MIFTATFILAPSVSFSFSLLKKKRKFNVLCTSESYDKNTGRLMSYDSNSFAIGIGKDKKNAISLYNLYYSFKIEKIRSANYGPALRKGARLGLTITSRNRAPSASRASDTKDGAARTPYVRSVMDSGLSVALKDIYNICVMTGEREKNDKGAESPCARESAYVGIIECRIIDPSAPVTETSDNLGVTETSGNSDASKTSDNSDPSASYDAQ